ncbi:DUF1640 domain-containing protein [Halochromatium roseum]|uniref:DUF1640 domain-containing protein n=1 Tax=Halochromatium roseum TaxID=391920 RepID=UPI001912C09B|nr:DUF1640 domain-containing protein [Halochromatium roseum]MBK5939418.1 DUF1640 domain-containing protein [Halochromatium roseum]
MTTLTFDTHKFIQALETTGFSRDQAEGLAAALKQIQEEQRPVTQEYLDYRLKSELAELKLDLIKWVTGALVAQAAIIATLVKLL